MGCRAFILPVLEYRSNFGLELNACTSAAACPSDARRTRVRDHLDLVIEVVTVRQPPNARMLMTKSAVELKIQNF